MTVPLSRIVPREQLLSRGAGFLYGVYPVFNLQIKGGVGQIVHHLPATDAN